MVLKLHDSSASNQKFGIHIMKFEYEMKSIPKTQLFK